MQTNNDKIKNITKFVNDYGKYIQEEINIIKAGDYYEVTVPYLDWDNDFIQFYIQRDDDQVVFTDDGITLHTFTQGENDCKIIEEKLNDFSYRFSVKLNNGEIVAKTHIDNFLWRFHTYIHGLLFIYGFCNGIKCNYSVINKIT